MMQDAMLQSVLETLCIMALFCDPCARNGVRHHVLQALPKAVLSRRQVGKAGDGLVESSRFVVRFAVRAKEPRIRWEHVCFGLVIDLLQNGGWQCRQRKVSLVPRLCLGTR